jgi:hypothetical protein
MAWESPLPADFAALLDSLAARAHRPGPQR